AHLPAEVAPHLAVEPDVEEASQGARRPEWAEAQKLIEAHREEAIRRHRPGGGVDPPEPVLPPLEALLTGAGTNETPGLGHARGRCVTPVANDVDELGLWQEANQRGCDGDRVAALPVEAVGPGLRRPE